MALPDLNSPTKVEGKNVLIQSIPTAATGVLTNSNGSNATLRLSSIYVSNVDGSTASDITAYIVDGSNITGYIASTISVPADASLMPITKDSNIYLMEDNTLYLQAGASGDLSSIVSYEDIT